MRKYLLRLSPLLVVVVLTVILHAAAQTSPTSNVPPYLNPSLPIDERVGDLVARMTLEEKASQLVNQARAIPRLQVPAYDWWSALPTPEPPRCSRSRSDSRRPLTLP